MQQRRLLVSTAFLGLLAGCSGSGGGGGGGGGSTTWRSIQEAEPNDTVGSLQDLGTTPARTGLRIHGATDPGDADLYQIDSSDYLDVRFTLTPTSPNCDLDLVLLDAIYFNTEVARFDATPPPLEETGSFEFLPGEILILAVISYGDPSNYVLEVECLPQGSLAAVPSSAGPGKATIPPSPAKTRRNDAKIARALGRAIPAPSTALGFVDVIEYPELVIVTIHAVDEKLFLAPE